MDFSDSFQQTRKLVRFSPDGRWLASCSQHRLVVREARTLQILHLHTCLDPVQQLEWSPDSSLLLCAMHKRGVVQVWSIEQPEWTCKIDEGSAGLVSACWSPDSRHILTTADFQLRVTLWSLVDKSVSYIKYPKLPHGGLVFTKDGRFMALAERRDSKDHLSVFDCQQWALIRHFEVGTRDLSGLFWSPDGHSLCVWDSPVDYKVLIYALDGRLMASFSPYSDVYEYGLGVRCVVWSPTGQFLAVGGYDEKLHVLNNITWKPVADFHHCAAIEDSKVVVYVEEEKKMVFSATATALMKGGSLGGLKGSSFLTQSKYEARDPPITVPNLRPDPEKPNPRLGVGSIRFSPDGRYIATINENMPSAVWLWDVSKLSLSVLLLQSSAVTDLKWDPHQSRLALCTGTSRLFLWSPAGCVSVVVPSDPLINVSRIAWHPDGTAIVLKGHTHFSVCYLRQD